MEYITSDDFNEKDCFDLLAKASQSNKFDFRGAACWLRQKWNWYDTSQGTDTIVELKIVDKMNFNNYVVISCEGNIMYSSLGDKRIIKDYVNNIRRQNFCNLYFN